MSQLSSPNQNLFETTTNSKTNNTNVVARQRKTLKWTPEEDAKLTELIEEFGSKNWKKISDYMVSRNPVQCLHRWSKILQPGLVKGPWTVEEDRKLIEWVRKQGAMKWSMCSEYIKGRSGKQCRERWYNNLSPDVVKGNWTAREDYMIFKLFSIQGSKWSKIAEHFHGRTENSIKNRFYSTLRRIGSKYTNIHGSANLDELLEYFPIALKEKEEELNKENEDQLKQESIRIMTPPQKLMAMNYIKTPSQENEIEQKIKFDLNGIEQTKDARFAYHPHIQQDVNVNNYNDLNLGTYFNYAYVNPHQSIFDSYFNQMIINQQL